MGMTITEKNMARHAGIAEVRQAEAPQAKAEIAQGVEHGGQAPGEKRRHDQPARPKQGIDDDEKRLNGQQQQQHGQEIPGRVPDGSRHLEQAEYELDGNTRSALIELRKQYNACESGASRLRAYERALVAAEALVVSTRKSVQGGERVNLDVLNAEQQLATTRRDLAQARYDYLLAWIKLHYQAGVLSETQLARVDEAFIEGKSG